MNRGNDDSQLTKQDRQKLELALSDSSKELRRKLGTVLLPEQEQRLETIAIEYAFSTGKVSKLMARILEFDETAKSKTEFSQFKDMATKVERQVEKKIAKLRRQTWTNALAELGEDQVEILEAGLRLSVKDQTTKRSSDVLESCDCRNVRCGLFFGLSTQAMPNLQIVLQKTSRKVLPRRVPWLIRRGISIGSSLC